MKRLFAAMTLLLPAAALAQTGLLVPTSTGRPDPAVLSLREMAIDVGIGRGYARVNVRQVFENHTGSIQEGTWRFALPPSGAVGDFAVWDSLVRIPGVILEKKRARAIYQQLTQQRIDPGLLQQGEEEDREPGASGRPTDRLSGGAAFSVKVAPIPAWGTKRLELQYQQEVPWLDGTGEFRVALKPRDGEPPTAGQLSVRITLLDGEFTPAVKGALALTRKGSSSAFSGSNVRLDKDVVVRFKPANGSSATLTTFRNPSGALPDGLALAPWERASDVPPEKDGFFLLEYRPSRDEREASVASGAKDSATSKGSRQIARSAKSPISLAILFDTSLSHRWSGLEVAYGTLLKTLQALRPEDRFVLIPFDRVPAPDPAGLAIASNATRSSALDYLKGRALAPGTDVAAAVSAGAKALSGASDGRILLLTDGSDPVGDLNAARQGRPLFTLLTGEERREGYSVASRQLVSLSAASASGSESADELLFSRALLGPAEKGVPAAAPSRSARAGTEVPFTIMGGDPKVRDVYAVLTQPPAHGSLSGWVGRYGTPTASTTLTLKQGGASTTAPFPETALEARDLPRRWARARVDDLLRRIELEGESRELIEEILALSRRYKFVTPYTAFLAAPRSLLRPRRIQPGDPVIRIEADPNIVAVTAYLPFGLEVALRRRPASSVWEGRFLVPEGLADGRLAVRLVLRDSSGATIVETKHLVLDGTPPTIQPRLRGEAIAGRSYLVAALADSDVIALSARLDGGPPVPLRWDPARRSSTAEMTLPIAFTGMHELFFEATDGAGNHGFARARLEIR